MLDFFRRYQKVFFFVITCVVITSFTFFGTYSTLTTTEVERKDVSVAIAIDGSKLMLSKIQNLSRFIATDREDPLYGRGSYPNFCNDGVIRHDFVKNGISLALVEEYFEALKPSLEGRLEKAKRFKPYVHPEAPFLSAVNVWNYFLPEMISEIETLQKEEMVTLSSFERLASLYQLQGRLPPEVLRRILIHQHQQYPWLAVDQRLSFEDLSLFSFHSAADWFGKDFIDLAAQFILNGARAAEERGYEVSLEEAKGDLLHNFEETLKALAESKIEIDTDYFHHLRSLGFDERLAAETWREVLLFRKYFEDVGQSTFVDTLAQKDFAEFAKEVALVHQYEWPICLKTGQDLAEFKQYIDTVCRKEKSVLSPEFLSIEEVEKKNPDLVETVYEAKVAEISLKEIALRSTMKMVWGWQVDDKNWPLLRKKFSLTDALTEEERFAILEKLPPKTRGEVDQFVRERLVEENPTWVEEALLKCPLQQKKWAVKGSEDPTLKKEGYYFRIEGLAVYEPKHILTFEKARPVLSKIVGKVDEEYVEANNPCIAFANDAIYALKKDPTDPKWIQTGADPLLDQFKLAIKQKEIFRNSEEDWMKEQAFLMLPDLWSPVHVADNGQIVFFYLQEKRQDPAPILEPLAAHKETVAADAKLFVAERLLKAIKEKSAIQIPLQGEE